MTARHAASIFQDAADTPECEAPWASASLRRARVSSSVLLSPPLGHLLTRPVLSSPPLCQGKKAANWDCAFLPTVQADASKGECVMRYLLAWLLGVPGVLILLWFLFAHLH
jgi:hypothetical protein